MVRLPGPMSFLEGPILRAVSWFLFRYVQGLSTEHTQRWRQMWLRIRDGGTLTLFNAADRSGAFHAMHMAIEDRIFEHQDCFEPDAPGKRAFRLWLKTGAVFGNYVVVQGVGLVFEPSSCNWEDCSDDEMREFHEAAMQFLRRPYALERLWPAARPQDRLEMLERLLKRPDGAHDGH